MVTGKSLWRRDNFGDADTDGDGFITLPELGAFMRAKSPNVPEMVIKSHFSSLDVEGKDGNPDGKLSRKEFEKRFK